MQCFHENDDAQIQRADIKLLDIISLLTSTIKAMRN